MKAQIEVQFNWILVLAAGTLIFLFFFGVVKWVKDRAEQNSAVTVSAYLDALLTGSSVARSTVTRFQLPSQTVHFICDSYRVGESDASKRIRNKIVFAPTRIEKGSFVAWSEPWAVPFRVTNFLLLGSPDIRYVFIGDENDPLFKELRAAFPPELEPEFNPSPFVSTNTYKVRVIVVNDVPSLAVAPFRSLASEDFTALSLSGTELDGSVTLTFYQKSHPSTAPQLLGGQSVTAYGKAAALGAIFTDTIEDYQCGIDKALVRMRNVAAIYEQRAVALSSSYAAHADLACQTIFDGNVFASYATAQPFDLSGLSTTLSISNFDAQRNSCALLY